MSAWPSSPGPTSAKLGSLYPTLVSTGQSLKRQVRSRGGQRWKIDLAYGPMLKADFAPILAFILAMRGQWNTATFVWPAGSYDTAQGSWAGTPVVNGAGQTGRTVNLRGFTPSQAGVVKAGDFLKFADTKVYVATADATSDGSGNAALAIEPALILSPADGEAVVHTSVPFTVALGADLAEFEIKPPLLHTFNVSLVEAY